MRGITPPSSVWWRLQIIELFIMEPTPFCHFNWLVQIFSAPCSHTPSVYVLSLMWETKFHAHTKTGKVTVFYILIFVFIDSRWEYKNVFLIIYRMWNYWAWWDNCNDKLILRRYWESWLKYLLLLRILVVLFSFSRSFLGLYLQIYYDHCIPNLYLFTIHDHITSHMI
jgi:hypothetical protein